MKFSRQFFFAIFEVRPVTRKINPSQFVCAYTKLFMPILTPELSVSTTSPLPHCKIFWKNILPTHFFLLEAGNKIFILASELAIELKLCCLL